MRFRIAQTEVRLSIGVLLLSAVLITVGEGKTLLIAVLSLLLHEFSHAVAAKNLGFAIRRVSLYPFGASMHLDPVPARRSSEWIAALAGPLGSFVIASAARAFCHLLPQFSHELEPFAHTNAAIALFNLLPAYPLDGGRIAKTLLLRVMPERGARRVSLAFTAAIAALLVLLGVYCLRRGYPAWTLFGIAPFLLISAFTEWKQADAGTVAHVLERRTAARAGEPVPVETVLIDGAATLGAAMQAVSKKRFTVFRVEMHGCTAETDENALLDAVSRFGYGALLKDIFSD